MSAAGDSQDGARARLLAIAAEQIRRDGAERLTVIRVARAAGMTHANVYRYFPSKAALVLEAATDWLRPVEQLLSDISQAPDPADDKLERFLTLLARSYEEKARSDPEIFAVFAAEAPERHQKRVRDLLARIVEEGIAIRRFPAGDPRRLETLILDALHRFLDPATIRSAVAEAGRAQAVESRRERLTRLVVRGVSIGRQ